MKILWVINGALPRFTRDGASAKGVSSTWLVSLADAVLRNADNELTVLYRGADAFDGLTHDGRLSYGSFTQPPTAVSADAARAFLQVLADMKPDVVHIFGTEYPHTLSALQAAATINGLSERTVVSIQGLCSVYARHYTQGLPWKTIYGYTLRDLLRHDNIRQQQRAFTQRGAFETAALGMAKHVIGRTDWDFACTHQINPALTYHKVNETLRAPFYTDRWTPEGCRRYSLFLPQSYYPVKGTHFALEALSFLKKEFPAAHLFTTGSDPRAADLHSRLRRSSYARYLAGRMRALGLDDSVTFLGNLDAEQMKRQYLSANVCISPSLIENSPNGVGEAMLLGTPVVASFVGGTASILTHGADGYLYPVDAPYMMAEYVRRIFADDALAETLSASARRHAAKTHDPEQNLKDLMAVYRQLAGGDA